MIRLPNTYYPDGYSFEEFVDQTKANYGDNWFTYEGVDYRLCIPDGEFAIVKDDDEFVPVFSSGTDSLDEFWDKPIFGYANFREFFDHIRPYGR